MAFFAKDIQHIIENQLGQGWLAQEFCGMIKIPGIKKHAIGLSIWMLLLTGCTTMYVPNAINAPILKSAGDCDATLNGSSIGLFNAQSAISPINHLIFLANISAGGTPSDLYMGDSITLNHYNYELGTGVYHTFKKAGTPVAGINLIGGYGHGYVRYNNSHPDSFFWYRLITNHYNKEYIQVSYDRYHKNYDMSFSLKASHINSSIHSTPDIVPFGQFNNITQINFNTIELAFTSHAKLSEYFSIFTQYKILAPLGTISGENYNIIVNDPTARFWQRAFGVSLGLTFNVGEINRANHQKKKVHKVASY